MPCMHPMPAWRSQAGIVSLGKEPPAATRTLQLPCGGCLGCRTSQAKGWAVRCLLELKEHDNATFTTLTYEDEKLPPTLRKRDLQLFLKRLRKGRTSNRIRFFACGEYGEKNGRPHYHAILYGISASKPDADRIDHAWQMGHTKTVAVTPAAIAYTAGYTAKKIGDAMRSDIEKERIDFNTGEIYDWQPPFLQMSRKPGIGGKAREKYTESWRDFAILNGTPIPVPRYLHKAWEETATPEEKEEREHEHYLKTLTRDRITKYQLDAMEKIAQSKQKLQAAKRQL